MWTNETENEIRLTADTIEMGESAEILRYAQTVIIVRFLNIINICWNLHKIPNECKQGVNCPIF
jgi:hypothetical protein